MNIRKYILISTFLGSLCSMTSAETFYVGGGGGKTTIDTGVTTGTASLDEDDAGFKFFGGVVLSQFFSVEYFYNYYGEATLSGNNGQTFTIDGTQYQFSVDNAEIKGESWATGFTPIISYPIPINNGGSIESISPFAKFGIHYWEVDYTISAGSATYAAATYDGWDYLWGLGAQINFNFNGLKLGFRGEYESTQVDDGDLDIISGSMLVRF
jgi:hypothetical protein